MRHSPVPLLFLLGFLSIYNTFIYRYNEIATQFNILQSMHTIGKNVCPDFIFCFEMNCVATAELRFSCVACATHFFVEEEYEA